MSPQVEVAVTIRLLCFWLHTAPWLNGASVSMTTTKQVQIGNAAVADDGFQNDIRRDHQNLLQHANDDMSPC